MRLSGYHAAGDVGRLRMITRCFLRRNRKMDAHTSAITVMTMSGNSNSGQAAELCVRWVNSEQNRRANPKTNCRFFAKMLSRHFNRLWVSLSCHYGMVTKRIGWHWGLVHGPSWTFGTQRSLVQIQSSRLNLQGSPLRFLSLLVTIHTDHTSIKMVWLGVVCGTFPIT